MTPTSALGGVVYGLSAGLLMVLIVLMAIHNPFRRTPARVVITSDAPARRTDVPSRPSGLH